MAQKTSLPKLEEGLLNVMSALNNQIARKMQRSPAEREILGVQKWQPYQEKIEEVTSFVLNTLEEGNGNLDSIFVLSQAFSKVLKILVDDLSQEGLGKLRTEYCKSTAENIREDMRLLLEQLCGGARIM